MELNPNHPVTREMRDQWHKIAAVLMWKMGQTEIEITTYDIANMAHSGKANITIDTRGDTFLTLRLVSDAEAATLAKKEGGLPH